MAAPGALSAASGTMPANGGPSAARRPQRRNNTAIDTSPGQQPASAEQQLVLALPQTLLEELAQRAATLVLERVERESPYLTVPEAACYLRCKRQRIDDLLSARQLTRYKDGRRTLVLRAELETLVRRASGPAGGPGGDWMPSRNRATVTNPDNSR